MFNAMTANSRKLVAILVIATLIVASLVVARSMGTATAKFSYLPALTMIYEVSEGAVISVGDGAPTVIREVHRLEYRSDEDWVDTVIEASPVLDLVPGGRFDRVGSYEKVEDNRLISFDASVGSSEDVDEEEISPDTIMVPNGALVPYSLDSFADQTPVNVDTDATVCIRDDCQPNARGIMYMLVDGKEIVFADYARPVPLRIGEEFVVRELRIEDGSR